MELLVQDSCEPHSMRALAAAGYVSKVQLGNGFALVSKGWLPCEQECSLVLLIVCALKQIQKLEQMLEVLLQQ